MSQDRKFFDIFMLVLGVLIIISLAIYALSARIGSDHFAEISESDAAYQEQAQANITPFGSVRRSADDIQDAAATETVVSQPVAAKLTGAQVYNQACLACHGAGIGGAPVIGNAEAWSSRLTQGIEVLRGHAVNGYQGSAGYMPPKGGRLDLSDEEIHDAVDFMIAESQ